MSTILDFTSSTIIFTPVNFGSDQVSWKIVLCFECLRIIIETSQNSDQNLVED